MPPFRDADDLRRYVGGIFETALEDEKLGPKLTATGMVFKVVTTEPDAVLVMDLPNKVIALGSPGDAADATMTTTSDLANRFWQGKVNMPVAMARGHVKVEGRIGALLKLIPSTKQLFPAYVELVTSDGRHDLLADA